MAAALAAAVLPAAVVPPDPPVAVEHAPAPTRAQALAPPFPAMARRLSGPLLALLCLQTGNERLEPEVRELGLATSAV